MAALSAVALNCTLKASPAKPSCELLLPHVLSNLADYDVDGEILRVVDFDVHAGVSSDEGDGDEWPQLRRRIRRRPRRPLLGGTFAIGTAVERAWQPQHERRRRRRRRRHGLYGSLGNDSLSGGDGDDSVTGDGDDTLVGDRGNDVVAGGGGRDYIRIDERRAWKCPLPQGPGRREHELLAVAAFPLLNRAAKGGLLASCDKPRAKTRHAPLIGAVGELIPRSGLADPSPLTGLRRELDTYLDYYKHDRVHHGRLTAGQIPADVLYGARKMGAR